MFVYGRNSVTEAIDDGLEILRVLVDTKKEEKFLNLIRRLRDAEIEVKFAKADVIDKEAKTRNHQGIAAEIVLPKNIVENQQEPVDWSLFNGVLALDGITDTGNLGAILRSALLFGMQAVVLPMDNSARITPVTIKASAGAVYKLNIFYVPSLKNSLFEMQSLGFCIYALMGQGAENITEVDFGEKACLIIGSERDGIRKGIRRFADTQVKIPTSGKLDSLNASVSAGVALWEWARNRGQLK